MHRVGWRRGPAQGKLRRARPVHTHVPFGHARMDTLRFGSSAPPPPGAPADSGDRGDRPGDRRWDKREGTMVGGEYTLVRRIGKGSGGAVYEARHEPSGQRVAVKVLHERLTGSDTQRRRFDREARTAAVVVHPNIVRLYDAGTDEDGTAWQVFELLEGRDLASLIEERTLTVPEAVWLAGELLEALEAVHARGFVHRDVKPENVFLATATGKGGAPFQVKLLDFGIAKPLVPSQSTPWVTDEGVLLGTPHFMAPEQITGDKPIAPTTDLWAMAAVIFTALTGRPPFDDRQLSKLLVRIAREPAPSILPLRPDVPESLASILARALRNHPAHRYPSASAMLAALDDALPQTLVPSR